MSNQLDVAEAKKILKGLEGNKEHALFMCDFMIANIIARLNLQKKWLRIREVISNM